MEINGSFTFLYGSKYCYTISNYKIKSKSVEIKAIKGAHETGKTNCDVDRVQTFDCELDYLPRAFGRFFNGLTCLAISSCGLEMISRMDLDGMDNLEILRAANNNLKSLPSNLFFNKHKMKEINFSGNKLEFLRSELLRPIMHNGLKMVNLRSNVKIDAAYYLEPYKNAGKADKVSLHKLMTIIEEQCSKPEDDDGFQDEEFRQSTAISYEKLWTTKAFTDFTIVAEGSKEFPVHKCILGIKSSVFAAALSIKMEEMQNGKMRIDDFSADAVEQFLAFIYTGWIPNDVHVMELFALASKYDIPKLKTLSQNAILKNLDDTNDLEIFLMGDLYSSPELKEKALAHITTYISGISVENRWLNDLDGVEKLVKGARAHKQKVKNYKEEFDAKIREANKEFENTKKYAM